MTHTQLAEFTAPIAALTAEERVVLRGQWLPPGLNSPRAALGIEDARWEGAFESADPLAGLVFLCTARETHWIKSGPPSLGPRLAISLHRASGGVGPATLAASLDSASLPSVTVRGTAILAASCTPHPGTLSTGRIHIVCEAGDAALAVLLLPARILRTGRNRLWRLRDELVPGLPIPLGEVLTKRRSGVLRPPNPLGQPLRISP